MFSIKAYHYGSTKYRKTTIEKWNNFTMDM